MKKVYHLIPTLNVGGAETMVKDYALLIDKSQFDIKIISIDKRYYSANEKALEDAGISVVFLSELHYPGDKELNICQKMIRKIMRYIDLRNILKTEKPDILHVHLYIGKYLKIVPLKKWGIQCFYTVHNALDHYYDTSGNDKRKYGSYLEIKRLLKKEDLQLIALHDEMNRELKEMFYTQKVVTVNNGSNLDRFHAELYDKNETKRILGIEADAFVIGNVGRFHQQKNHELIIDVMKVLSKQRKTHLLLVGDGPLREKIEEEIKIHELENMVTILSNRSDIPELMNIMDVFLFPSRWEGFGNVLIEAQSMGLPCVVSDKIPADALVNDNISIVKLNAPIDDWVKAVTSVKRGKVSDRVESFNIRNSVRCLEKLYMKREEGKNI